MNRYENNCFSKKTSSKSLSIVFLIFVMSVFFYGPLYLTYKLDFNQELRFETVLASNLDFLFNVLLIIYIFIFTTSYVEKINYFFQVIFPNILQKYNYLLYFMFVILLYIVSIRIYLIIDGISREELIFENSASRIMWILSPLVTLLTGIAFAYQYNKKTLMILFFCLLLVSIYSLSRSQFLFASFVFLIIYSMKGITLKSLFKLTWLILCIILLMSIMTIFQGRADTLLSSVDGLFTALFKYRSFSFYLAEHAIDKIEGDFEQLFFPFFGFFIERFLSLFSLISNPISVQESSFVFDFIPLGTNSNFDANVLYPWWSWFYGAFGLIGVLVKFIFCFFIFRLLQSVKLNFCFIYFLYIMCFYGSIRHPLLDNSNVYAFLTFLFFDVIIIYYYRFTQK